MCGIAGFCSFEKNFFHEERRYRQLLHQMGRVQKHRGPDDDGIYLSRHCGLSHVRLSVIDPLGGHQPMCRQHCTICLNGEIYNTPALRRQLQEEGASFTTNSDTEVVLQGFLLHGRKYIDQLNGIFALALWDEEQEQLLLARDRLGLKPLFYTMVQNTLVFSSEIKGLFAYPGIEPVADRESLCEIFGLGPAKTYGKGVFKDILELLPGHFLEFQKGRLKKEAYWQLISKPHKDSWEETLEKTGFLVTDAVKLQMLSDVPICTFLSGGLDSSLVTSICSRELAKQGRQLDTYSFDFCGNDLNFKANDFQPSQDRPWVEKMAACTGVCHHYLECSSADLFRCLFQAVEARDLPCMADVEASMLYFCQKVSARHKVALTGECADEIFGGYPWFHKKECFEAHCFPWSMDLRPRTMLLREKVKAKLPIEEYVYDAYRRTLSETPPLESDTPEERRRREISYLNLKWFMQTLLDRMDRTSMHAGLEARAPFADHRIVEYLWNVPWHMKCKDGAVKGLLRRAAKDWLPDEILYRRKSPYPKTYDPTYEALLRGKLLAVLKDGNAPLGELIDLHKAEAFLETPSDYGKPFYGQLMAGPQLLAYLLQINYWLEHYHVQIRL